MQAVAAKLEAFGRASVVIAVAVIAGAERIEIGFAAQVKVAGGDDSLSVEAPGGVELQGRVDTTDAVELARGRAFPIGIQGADLGLAEDVAAEASDREIRAHSRVLAVVGNCK